MARGNSTTFGAVKETRTGWNWLESGKPKNARASSCFRVLGSQLGEVEALEGRLGGGKRKRHSVLVGVGQRRAKLSSSGEPEEMRSPSRGSHEKESVFPFWPPEPLEN